MSLPEVPHYNLARFDFVSIRLAVACARMGNLTEAACECNLVLPAASQRLRDLERALGGPLFERHSRGVPPTALGLAFMKRGMGLANVLASVQEGIDRFDGSLGGLGGCPYATGATGNICSEDAIHMLHAMGFETGIDLPRLLAVARRLPEVVGHDVPGQVAKAGLITDLHPAPSYVAELRSQFS